MRLKFSRWNHHIQRLSVEPGISAGWTHGSDVQMSESAPVHKCCLAQQVLIQKDDFKLDELGRCCRRLIAMKLGPTGGYLTIACPDVISLACHREEAAGEDYPTALADALSLGLCVCLVCGQSNSGTQPSALSGGFPAWSNTCKLTAHTQEVPISATSTWVLKGKMRHVPGWCGFTGCI